jgi:hypothetical protein
MELKITVHTIVIKDKDTGEETTVKTVRTAEEISGYVDETEKDACVDAFSSLNY